MAHPNDNALIAQRLRQAREYLDFTQEEVAAALGCARTTVTDIESGRRKVSAAELSRLAKLYNRPAGWLLGEQELASAGVEGALYARVRELSDEDREQVLRFAEFLATANARPPRGPR
ncbi:MAG: helix-turn-helix transcriptional regulator [Propionibacteriaceae bacterium]|jgi:transcriptional regulator with XRE-family HTH domain|nr:helix-turn-helix transcriptional regulator [Propionibacteriaceae bacterium]